MQERRYAGVPYVVVLSVRVQSRRGAERRIGGGRTGVSQRAGCGDETGCRSDRETELHCERAVDGRDYGDRAERGPDSHRNEQPNGQHEEGPPELASADQRYNAVYKVLNGFSLSEDRAVTGGDEHYEGYESHYFKTAEKTFVNIFEFQHPGDDHDEERHKRSQRH